MRNENKVCFDCRLAVRRKLLLWAAGEKAVCPDCHKEMTSVGRKWRVPKKTDNVGWKKMRRLFERK